LEKQDKVAKIWIPDPEKWREIQQEVGLLGESKSIQQIIETIEQVAATDISVLITGQSGTGKEIVAKAIHTLSRRRTEPLITVNCAAIPEGILESELFGHEKGSFTGAVGQRQGYFELADNGSIFLDEVGELPLSIQVKLLRVLESREFMRVGGVVTHKVNVRIIAATNKNIEVEVRKGYFRQDLFFRLNAIRIHVPSLYERVEDIPVLAKKFANDFCRENHIEFQGFSGEALHAMQDYRWPGNVRELRNLVEKIIVLERARRIDGPTIRKYLKFSDSFDSILPVPIQQPKEEVEKEFILRALLEIKSEISQLRELLLTFSMPRPSLNPWRKEITPVSTHFVNIDENGEAKAESVAEMEKEMIRSTLAKTGWNKRNAAKILGFSERTLYRKIEKYGLK
jgi:DNA-binding NtrC family response regulator